MSKHDGQAQLEHPDVSNQLGIPSCVQLLPTVVPQLLAHRRGIPQDECATFPALRAADAAVSSEPKCATHQSQQVGEIELAEEAGLAAASWTHLGRLHAGYGRSSTAFDVFLAEGLSAVPTRREPTEQDMRTGTFTLAEIWDLVHGRLVTDSHTVAALALLDQDRQRSPSHPEG